MCCAFRQAVSPCRDILRAARAHGLETLPMAGSAVAECKGEGPAQIMRLIEQPEQSHAKPRTAIRAEVLMGAGG